MKRQFLAICLAVAVIALLMISLVFVRSVPSTQEFTQAEFVQKLQSNLIARAEVIYESRAGRMNLVRGTFYQTDATGKVLLRNGHPTELRFRASVYLTEDFEMKLLAKPNFAVVERRW